MDVRIQRIDYTNASWISYFLCWSPLLSHQLPTLLRHSICLEINFFGVKMFDSHPTFSCQLKFAREAAMDCTVSPPNSYVKILSPNVITSENRAVREEIGVRWDPKAGVLICLVWCPYMKRPESFFLPQVPEEGPHRNSEDMWWEWGAGERDCTRTNSAGPLILDF